MIHYHTRGENSELVITFSCVWEWLWVSILKPSGILSQPKLVFSLDITRTKILRFARMATVLKLMIALCNACKLQILPRIQHLHSCECVCVREIHYTYWKRNMDAKHVNLRGVRMIERKCCEEQHYTCIYQYTAAKTYLYLLLRVNKHAPKWGGWCDKDETRPHSLLWHRHKETY